MLPKHADVRANPRARVSTSLNRDVPTGVMSNAELSHPLLSLHHRRLHPRHATKPQHTESETRHAGSTSENPQGFYGSSGQSHRRSRAISVVRARQPHGVMKCGIQSGSARARHLLTSTESRMAGDWRFSSPGLCSGTTFAPPPRRGQLRDFLPCKTILARMRHGLSAQYETGHVTLVAVLSRALNAREHR